MKKYALIVLLLASLAVADVSQEEAGITCRMYGKEVETIQVSGPISCEGDYWVCEFYYYGNRQNFVVMVDKLGGQAVSATDEIIQDLLSTEYAIGSGSSQVFDNFLTDNVFAIELRGMNSTLTNYRGILESLLNEGHIERTDFIDFKERILVLQEVTAGLAERIDELYNLSIEFWDSPNCAELLFYLEDLEETLGLAENFSASWNEFIRRYNALAGSVEPYVATINPSDGQVMEQNLALIKSYLESYQEDESEFIDTVLDNLRTRFDMKETKDKLDEAYDLVKVSKNPDAHTKYDEAVAAFNNDEYSTARILAKEAIALAPIDPTGNGETPVIIKEAPDITPYLIVIIVLVAAILVITLLKRRGEGEEEEEVEEEKPKKEKKGKKEKTQKWEWSGGGSSALGRV